MSADGLPGPGRRAWSDGRTDNAHGPASASHKPRLDCAPATELMVVCIVLPWRGVFIASPSLPVEPSQPLLLRDREEDRRAGGRPAGGALTGQDNQQVGHLNRPSACRRGRIRTKLLEFEVCC